MKRDLSLNYTTSQTVPMSPYNVLIEVVHLYGRHFPVLSNLSNIYMIYHDNVNCLLL